MVVRKKIRRCDENMTVNTLERTIFEKEEIRVIIRLPKYQETDCVYDYQRKSGDNVTLSSFLDLRIYPLLEKMGLSEDYVEVIDGHGNFPHMHTKLGIIRSSYVE